MKFILYFTLIIIAFRVGAPGEAQFQQTPREKCPANYFDLEYDLSGLDQCFKERLASEFVPFSLIKSSEDLCTFITRNVAICITNVINKYTQLKPSISHEEQQFHDFIIQVCNKIAETTCTYKKIDEIKVLYLTLKRNKCIERMQQNSEIFKACSLKTSSIGSSFVNKNVCLDVETIGTCLTKILPKVCIGAYLELLTAIFRPTINACISNTSL